jgi:hypothetical protein
MARPCRDRLPGRPADVDPDTSLATLLDGYHRHLLQLATARTAPPPAPSMEIAERALAALAIGHTVVRDLFEERWAIVRDALVHGASYTQVGAATGGLEPDELAAGLTAWADRRLAAGLMTDAEHDAVLALVDARLARVLHRGA